MKANDVVQNTFTVYHCFITRKKNNNELPVGGLTFLCYSVREQGLGFLVSGCLYSHVVVCILRWRIYSEISISTFGIPLLLSSKMRLTHFLVLISRLSSSSSWSPSCDLDPAELGLLSSSELLDADLSLLRLLSRNLKFNRKLLKCSPKIHKNILQT